MKSIDIAIDANFFFSLHSKCNYRLLPASTPCRRLLRHADGIYPTPTASTPCCRLICCHADEMCMCELWVYVHCNILRIPRISNFPPRPQAPGVAVQRQLTVSAGELSVESWNSIFRNKWINHRPNYFLIVLNQPGKWTGNSSESAHSRRRHIAGGGETQATATAYIRNIHTFLPRSKIEKNGKLLFVFWAQLHKFSINT